MKALKCLTHVLHITLIKITDSVLKTSDSNTPKIFKPANFEAIGEIIKRTLQALRSQFGQFDLISAHSAGCCC